MSDALTPDRESAERLMQGHWGAGWARVEGARLLCDRVERVIRAARAEGFKAGQEAMRERAATYSFDFGDRTNKDEWTITRAMAGVHIAEGIRALPIEEPTP